MKRSPAPITAIVTAYRRVAQTLQTLRVLEMCVPAPAEILVHVDGNEVECAAAVSRAFPHVRVILSSENVGPGGGRNKLIASATYPVVASFDDDSYPVDPDYFRRVTDVLERFPNASIVAAAVYHRGEPVEPAAETADWVADFCGCACVYRRNTFIQTAGYVPLRVAYGMEEVDLALRLHGNGGAVLRTSWLRVFHDTDLSHHASAAVTSASIVNQALLTYLRYPKALWGIGIAQCASRVQWLLRNGRRRGILAGVANVPRHLLGHRQYRQRVPAAAVLSYLHLRKRSQPADWN